MIEAYTIGIRLALDDGISEHIRAMREDLATINRAADTSGARIHDFARIGRELRVPGQPVQIESRRENVAPVPDELAVARAIRRKSKSSDDGENVDDRERPTLGEEGRFRAASELSVAPAPRLPSQVAISMAPRDESPRTQPAVRVGQANSVPDMSGRAVPDRQFTNLAEIGRAISPIGDSLLKTSLSVPVAELAHDLPGEPKPVAQPMPVLSPPHHLLDEPRSIVPGVPETSPIDDASDFGPEGRPMMIAVPGLMTAVAPAPSWRLAVPAAQPARQTGPIAPAGTAGSASGLPSPAPVVSRNVGEPSESSRAAPQDSAHGELVIDGLAIGRWISDHLADRAVRPHSGFSGMDPRLSPAWPGVVSSG